MEHLLFLIPSCTSAAVIVLFPSIILHGQKQTFLCYRHYYFPHFLSSPIFSSVLLHPVFSASFQWIQHFFVWDCQVHGVTIGYIWMCGFGQCSVSMSMFSCMYASRENPYPYSCQTQQSPMKPNPKSIELYMCTVLIVSRIDATLLSLIYIPWSPCSLGAL